MMPSTEVMSAAGLKGKHTFLYRAHLQCHAGFNPNCYVEVGKEGVDAKIKALSMYRGVMRPYLHPRSAEYISGLAAVRGSQWGVNYAEAFEVVLREY